MIRAVARPLKPLRLMATVLAAACIGGCVSSMQLDVKAALGDPARAGTSWGLLVTTLAGDEVFALRPDERFLPASNTKMLTTAAIFHRLRDLDLPDTSGASLRLEPRADGGPPDLVLVGRGDATLADSPDCVWNCLAHLADAVAASNLARVGDIIGDDRLFPDERWGPGWSWNNLQTRSGAAVSALTVNDNVLTLEVLPGDSPGSPARAAWRAGDDLHPLINEAVTIDGGDSDLRIERLPGANPVRLYGRIAPGQGLDTLMVGVEDPALIAAARLRRLLEQRGVAVEGATRARHRPLALIDEPAARGEAPYPPPAPSGADIARLAPLPLIHDLRVTSKISQNLHAELMLRRLGLLEGGGSIADGLAVVEDMLAEAGADRTSFDFADGSGMSVYNRVTPRMMTRFLVWTAAQPWGAAWRDTLPTGGVDGTLERRFRGTPLEGRIFAKTGSLSAVNALSGFLIAASGQTLVFSAYANDQPVSAPSATIAIDAALLEIAAAR